MLLTRRSGGRLLGRRSGWVVIMVRRRWGREVGIEGSGDASRDDAREKVFYCMLGI